MLKAIVAYIRRENRARLERRHLAKANPALATGVLGRLARRFREWNHARLARRHAHRQVLASLAANDTAVLEALVFLLKAARQAEQAHATSAEALRAQVAAVEGRVDAGFAVVASRLQALESRIGGAPANGVPAGRAAAGARNEVMEEPALGAATRNGERQRPALARGDGEPRDPAAARGPDHSIPRQ